MTICCFLVNLHWSGWKLSMQRLSVLTSLLMSLVARWLRCCRWCDCENSHKKRETQHPPPYKKVESGGWEWLMPTLCGLRETLSLHTRAVTLIFMGLLHFYRTTSSYKTGDESLIQSQCEKASQQLTKNHPVYKTMKNAKAICSFLDI